MAPRYVGASTATRSPGSMRIFPRPSRTPCDPVAINTSLAVVTTPVSARRSLRAARRGGNPSVRSYWSEPDPYLSNTLLIRCPIDSMGKLSGEGMPPAREMIPGRATTFRISRIALTFIWAVRAASSKSAAGTTRPSRGFWRRPYSTSCTASHGAPGPYPRRICGLRTSGCATRRFPTSTRSPAPRRMPHQGPWSR